MPGPGAQIVLSGLGLGLCPGVRGGWGCARAGLGLGLVPVHPEPATVVFFVAGE